MMWNFKHGLDTGNFEGSVEKGVERIVLLLRGASRLWVKSYTNNLNVLLAQPIRIRFPKSLETNMCQSEDKKGKTIAWSCAYKGETWIIPEHADHTVIQHELGHIINHDRWGGKMPDGSGGRHIASECYNPGLALSEGFASFLAYWTQLERNSSQTDVGFGPIETLGDDVCKGETNERRVTATFWDMYDVPSEWVNSTSNDSWYFALQAAAIKLYLNNGKLNSMKEFMDLLKSKMHHSTGPSVEALFRLNTIIP